MPLPSTSRASNGSKNVLLAIETSCDETCAALFDLDAYVSGRRPASECLLADLVSSQVSLHSPYGGVVPEIAAREHVMSLPLLVKQALEQSGRSKEDVAAVAVTRGPGLKGCLLVGISFAKAFSYSLGVPLLALNHLEGHIFAGLLSQRIETALPMLALIVSGGHTMLVSVEGFRRYRLVARTRDDAAGEAFDKAATLLGLPYPGGPALSRLARTGNRRRYRFPVALPSDESSFSFSGLKTAVLRCSEELGPALESENIRADVAASVEEAIVTALVDKTVAACRRYPPRTLLLSGGVAANDYLRLRLAEVCGGIGIDFLVPEKRWCTDNAAMMALLGAEIAAHQRGDFSAWRATGWGADALGPGVPWDLDALARWPICPA